VFPSELSSRSDNKGRHGYFEYLTAVVAVSFKGDDSSLATSFAKDFSEDGGIFFYTADEKAAVRRTHFSGKVGDFKFMDMISYLFELGYDLALSPANNVSDSPGFEGCGLIFDKKKFAVGGDYEDEE